MFKNRSQEQEQLDVLNVTGDLLAETMDGLAFINRFLGNKNSVKSSLKKVISAETKSISIIDLGCGGGDSLRAMADLLRSHGIKARLLGVDGNPAMIDYATSKSTDYPEIRYQCANIMAGEFIIESCDVLCSTHFIYHFEDEALAEFLKQNRSKVSTAIIFSDLQRHWLPYILFWFISSVLPFNRILREDGLAAIRRAYIRKDLENILRMAELRNYELKWKWAFRYQTVIDMTAVHFANGKP